MLAGEYLVLQLDASKLTNEVKFEAAAPVGGKPTTQFGGDDTGQVETFPHLYGSIDFEAVDAELSVARSGTGEFLSIEGIRQ